MGEVKSHILRHAKAAKENDKGYTQAKFLFYVARPVMILVGTLGTCALMLFYIMLHLRD